MKLYSNATACLYFNKKYKKLLSCRGKKKDTPTTKKGLSVSNHNYPSLLTVMYLIMLHGELKALQVSHSDGAAQEHRVVRA